MNPGQAPVIVALSPQEVLRLRVLLTDKDPDAAWTFLRELYAKIEKQTRGAMTSHLDA
jgi:hypothetical protein